MLVSVTWVFSSIKLVNRWLWYVRPNHWDRSRVRQRYEAPLVVSDQFLKRSLVFVDERPVKQN